MFGKSILAVATLAAAASASAITVDGNYDAVYGAPKTVVPYSAGPNGDFNNYGPAANPGYSIYLAAAQGSVYGYFHADSGATPLPFANVYFDIDPQNGNGSDLVFELSAGTQNISALYNAPVPIHAPGITVALSADGTGIEFAIPNHYFTTAYPGVDYAPNQAFATVGGPVTLRITQAFGYDVVGGPSFGPGRLGSVDLAPGVPEPASWALMVAGFGLIGATVRRRRSVVAA